MSHKARKHDNHRSLAQLYKSGSTSRVINLLSVATRAAASGQKLDPPFFTNPTLNRAFILKHRLRSNEIGVVGDRATATKLILPFDANNLPAGGRSAFISQPGFEAMLEDALGASFANSTEDIRILKILDGLPSFDPFLLREWLAKAGIHPHRDYFELSDAAAADMENFVATEISMLVSQSLAGQAHSDGLTRLVRKMLASAYDGEMEPLRLTLRLSPSDFQEGMFCWKGFLYYKWAAVRLEGSIKLLITQMRAFNLRRIVSSEDRAYAEAARVRVGRALVAAFNQTAAIIEEYNRSYELLTQGRRPLEFREFLLASPRKFLTLGEYMGQMQHVTSFWAYRNPASGSRLTPDEYLDLLRDFEDGLAVNVELASAA